MRIQLHAKARGSRLGLGGILLTLTMGGALADANLEQRVLEYWKARQINDIPTFYRLEAAALPGGGLTPDQYQRIIGLPVQDVKILQIKVEDDKAEVQIEGQIEVGALGWTPQIATDLWILVDDQWYRQTPGFTGTR